MADFRFRGTLPASKSILNRALIIQSFFPHLKIVGDSACDDVVFMKKGLAALAKNQTIPCGEGGTTFRFLALRASRVPGPHTLTAEARLLKRPQQELVSILKKLGIEAQLSNEGMVVSSASGWKDPGKVIEIQASESSQYASSLLLNAWNLDFDLCFSLMGKKVSESYFSMTLEMVRHLGMQVQEDQNVWTVPRGQKIIRSQYMAEPDLSSSLVFAAAGALFGECEIQNFPQESLQPDRAFVEAFQQMGIACRIEGDSLWVEKGPQNLKPLHMDISQSPDLFPVLSVLCSFVPGKSHLYGAPHLALKESNRIQKVAELFDRVGIRYQQRADGMVIEGGSYPLLAQKKSYDPAHDHRMVMAAALLKKAGHPLEILDAECVAKSLPEFFELFQESP